MATKNIKGHCVTTLPIEVALLVFQYVDEIDLCRVAMVSRAWRETANQDSLWRTLCRRNGWEHYGTSSDISRKTPYVPLPSSVDQQVTDVSASVKRGSSKTKTKPSPQPLRVLNPAAHKDVSFKMNSIIANGNTTGLIGTCKWKEIFMKAHHLENNWRTQNYNVCAFDLDGLTFTSYEDEDSDGFVKGDGDYLAARVTHSLIKVWNVNTGTERQISLKSKLTNGAFSRAQNSLQVKNGIVVIGCEDGKIRAFSVTTEEELQVMKGHKATEVIDVFFDGETIVSRAESDNDIRVWHVADGTCRHLLRVPSEGTEVKKLDYRENMVAASCSDECARLWDTRSGKCLHTLKKPAATESTLSLCKLGDRIVVCGDEEGMAIHLWSKESGECVAAFTPENVNADFICDLYCFHGLFVIQYYDDESACAFLVYDENGERLNKEEFTRAMMPIIHHGSKCVLEMEDRYSLDECHLYKVTNEGLEHMWQINDPRDSGRSLAILWMDNTKILLRDTELDSDKRFEDRYIVCHFW